MWVGYNDNVKLKHCTSLNNPGAGAGAEQLFYQLRINDRIAKSLGAGAPSKFALLQYPGFADLRHKGSDKRAQDINGAGT